jgi:sarcosine oxidase, subunit alpha
MPFRLSAPREPVELFHDGESLLAERGESLAAALLAADRLPLARSPKLHRPRGPYCLRGGCDGCLARVDGVPNVMTCLRAAQGGEQIETQNVLGSRELDLLRATDFLFPRGIDHHKIFAGVRGLSTVVQGFARRVAGLGLLPEQARSARPGRRRELDVLIVGGGAAGLAAAELLGSCRTLLVDDALTLGGSLSALDPGAAADAVARARKGGAQLDSSTTALGLYREPESTHGRVHALLAGPKGTLLASARAVLLATGAHDPVLAFSGNDLPGVMSARAALKLLRAGIASAQRIVCAGAGRFNAGLAQAGSTHFQATAVEPSSIVRAIGRTRLSGVIVRAAGSERKLAAGALLVDGPAFPSVELAVQAGASVTFDPIRGYAPTCAASGEVAESVWCAGSCAGTAVASAIDGARVAGQIDGAL